MHELSLAVDVIDLVTNEAGKNGLSEVREILIEVGTLCGVEVDAFEWALGLAGKDTILENAVRKINRPPGIGFCSRCKIEFEMENILDTCPECSNGPGEIKGGREFRVVSITGE